MSNHPLGYRTQIRAENASFFLALPIEEKDARSVGSFFATFEAIVVTSHECPIAPSNFPIIRRDPQLGKRIYPTTADPNLLDVCDESSSLHSDTTNTAQLTTTVDFLFNEQGERAHLLSNAPVCHAAYFQLAQAASGIFTEDYFIRRKLLNGMKGRRNRMKDSGIKHSKFNKLHLFMQKELLDSTPPALIIVPLLTISQIKQWDGISPYNAMALPCGEQAVYAASMSLRYVRTTCSQSEVEIGVEVLRAFVKDIAESLLDKENDVLGDFDTTVGENTRDASALRWKGLVEYLRTRDSPCFPIPNMRNNLDWEAVRVAKGTFDRDSSCLPDPFLLAAKAAINYSSLVGKKLMPACQKSSSNGEEAEEEDNDDF
jgi:hypothetical protein